MNNYVVALILGFLAVCARAENVDSLDVLAGFAGASGFDSPAGSFDADGVAPEIDNIQKYNYTLLLGSWPRTVTLEDIRTHNGRDFYALVENNLGKNLTVFMRVEPAGTLQLQGQISGVASSGGNIMPEYIVGTGLLLSNSWQAGDGLGIAIAQLPSLRIKPIAYTHELETAWEVSYFLPLLKSLKAQTSVHYPIVQGKDVHLEEAIAAELRLNFKF